MTVRKYANNAGTTLAVGIASGDVSCTLAAGTGALFPTLTAGDVFYATITDAATKSLREIVLVTARSTDTCTITRAQQGTAARAYLAGDTFEQLITADLGTNAAYIDQANSFSQLQTVIAATAAGNPVRLDQLGVLTQNSKGANYTTVLADGYGRHILHPSADTTPRTFTIDSNANVPYPIGAAIEFVNQASAGVLTIAITSDTMRLAGAGTTGSRTLAANGVATALKITATEWIISGVGLT